MSTTQLSFLMQSSVCLVSDKDGNFYHNKVYSRLSEIKNRPNFITVKKGRTEYLNIPTSFDIETSSFKEGIAKKAIMYIWSYNINGTTFYGRTWSDFIKLLEEINDVFRLQKVKRRMITYVHNLEYEWQFIRKWIKWFDVFADDKRSPLYAISELGIEFRCSYRLSGYSLAKVGDDLRKYKTAKAVGDLDYSLLRNSASRLTGREYYYVFQDTKVVVCYIQEEIERNGGLIVNIPYTKTGYVRRYCREKTVKAKDENGKLTREAYRYREIIKSLTLKPEEYIMCKEGFQGGFTHGNVKHINQTLHNVGSIDFTSSYPFVMVGEYMPMSSPIHIHVNSWDQLIQLCQTYCVLFRCRFTNIRTKNQNENTISASRCHKLVDYHLNNGRVIDAATLETTITELDMDIIWRFYSFDSIEIGDCMIFRRGYLPTPLVDAILKLYEDKTKLKGVEGMEVEYLLSKGMLNSAYGMAVTDIIRENMSYVEDCEDSSGWDVSEGNRASQLAHYNNSAVRFLYYPWGVWVTAHARHNLFSGIEAFGDDYVYSDTDSIKALNMDKHKDYIDQYNESVRRKLEKASRLHNIPMERFEPETIKGVKKLIGVWDYEGTYDKFKTLGAKRYLVQKGDDVTFTVAGCNKQALKKYMTSKYNNDEIFEHFTRNLSIPAESTGKLTHSYIDLEYKGMIPDYQGNWAPYHEKASVHLEPAPFKISLIDEFWDYIRKVQQVEK